MADNEVEEAHASDVGQPSITEDFTSTTSEAPSTRHHDVDAGHERLLKHTASNEGKGISHCRVSRPPHYLVLAVLVAVLNLPFGFPAIIFSLLSRRSYRHGKYERAKQYGNISKWLSLVGLAVAAVLIAFTIVYFVHIDKNIVDTPEELNAG